MYDDIALLIGHAGTPTYDEYGNEIVIPAETKVFVQPRGVYRSEFYAAASAGLKPEITFVLANRADYHGEKIVRFHGRLFNVIRADWVAQRDAVNLVCETRVGDNGE